MRVPDSVVVQVERLQTVQVLEEGGGPQVVAREPQVAEHAWQPWRCRAQPVPGEVQAPQRRERRERGAFPPTTVFAFRF